VANPEQRSSDAACVSAADSFIHSPTATRRETYGAVACRDRVADPGGSGRLGAFGDVHGLDLGDVLDGRAAGDLDGTICR